jgi:hypothetical protein
MNNRNSKIEARNWKLAAFLLSAFCLLPSAFCQQPQAQSGQPVYAVNAKYVQGVGPGYWPTKGTGLTLNLTAGTASCSSTVVTYAGGTLTMAANATNSVYLDPSNNCMPASATSGFPSGAIVIATAVTGSNSITTITDVRTMFAYTPGAGGGGGNWMNEEGPSGQINGVNETFTVAHAPSPAGSLRLVLNGLTLHSGAGNDFTLSGNTITFLYAPPAGSNLICWYEY